METTKTYVEYLYPGSFVSESETKEVKTRDADKIASSLPKNAFAFKFFDQTSKETTVDGEKQKVWGKQKNVSGAYYPGGQRYTLEEVKKLGKSHSILAFNMEGNNWPIVVKTRIGNFQPFLKGDRII